MAFLLKKKEVEPEKPTAGPRIPVVEPKAEKKPKTKDVWWLVRDLADGQNYKTFFGDLPPKFRDGGYGKPNSGVTPEQFAKAFTNILKPGQCAEWGGSVTLKLKTPQGPPEPKKKVEEEDEDA